MQGQGKTLFQLKTLNLSIMSILKKSTTWLAALSLAVIVGIAGCDNSKLTSSDSPSNDRISAADGSSDIATLRNLTKNDLEKRLQEFAEEQEREGGVAEQKLSKWMPYATDQSNFREFITERAIDGDQYECGPTDLNTWANDNLFYSSFGELLYVIFFGIDQYPYIYNLIFVDPDEERQYFGYEGEYTRQVRRADRSIKRFWDVNLRDVDVEGFHGSMLKDFDKVFMVVEALYPDFSEESNAEFAQSIVDVVVDGNAPVWSFNAFAFREGPILVGGEDKPDQIQMGDGIMAGLDAIGYGDAAPEAILAHEFAHQVQYELNVFEEDTISDPAESTRRTELMADAYAAYYLGHKRGASMNWDRVEQFMQAFYSIGDCSFTSPGHHGTPNQRLKAAKFGFDLAENAERRVRIMPASDFLDAFDAELPELVAPDAED